MHVHVAVALEGREDAQGCVRPATQRVDQDVDFFPFMLGENLVHIVCIEVESSDEALQVKLVISFCVGCHNALNYGTKIHYPEML